MATFVARANFWDDRVKKGQEVKKHDVLEIKLLPEPAKDSKDLEAIKAYKAQQAHLQELFKHDLIVKMEDLHAADVDNLQKNFAKAKAHLADVEAQIENKKKEIAKINQDLADKRKQVAEAAKGI